MRLRVPVQPTDAVVDAAAAGGLLVLGLLEAALRPPPLSRLGLAGLAVLWSVPLAWRRHFPIPVLAIVVVVGPMIITATKQGGVISYVLAGILASFTVGRHLDPPATWWGPVLSVGFPWAGTALMGGVLSDYFFFALLYGSPWMVGFILRQRERRITELAGEATQLRERQAERERRAIANERARIARELHDIIAHSISVITIQTQAIRRRLGPDHAAEADDLQADTGMASDTNLATYAGHQLSGRWSFRKQRTVNPRLVTTSSTFPQGQPAGGRQRHDGHRRTGLTLRISAATKPRRRTKGHSPRR